MVNKKQMILQTQYWLDNIIIAHNICPFAKKERIQGSIRFYVEESSEINMVLEKLVRECQYLDQNSEIETSLFILAQMGKKFADYLDFLELASQLINSLNYEGIYQLASFHPDYCFAQCPENDAANYTNRSPYPMLHIIREQSLEKALKNFKNPEQIPGRNIALCHRLGLEKMQQMLADCYLKNNNE